MSTASSPRLDKRHGPRARTPSKATPTAVHIDAHPTYGHSVEEKALSRQTLSKHLTSGRAGVPGLTPPIGGLARQRSSSSASVNSALSVRSSASTDANDTSRREDLKSTSPLATPSGTPLSSPSLARRRASAGPAAPPRSPSWYRSTSRKGGLALPTLSTIEGSVSDLRTQEIDSHPVEQDSPDIPAEVGSESLPLAGSSSSTMKRDRPSAPGSDNPKLAKRQATADVQEAEDHQTKAMRLTPSTSGALHASEMNGGAVAVVRAKGSLDTVEDQAKPESVQAPSVITPLPSGWLSYLTLPRSPRPQSVRKHATSVPIGGETTHEPSSTAAGVDSGSHPSLEARAPSSHGSSIISESKETTPTSTRLDIKVFAASVVDSSSAKPSDSYANGVKDASDSQADIPAAATHPNGTLRAPVTRQSLVSSSASQEQARPVSWWGWGAKVEMPQPVAQPVLASDSTVLLASDSVNPALNNAQPSECDEDNDATKTPRASDKDLQPARLAGESSTWSSWIGAYVGNPVATTTMTYAAGVAPSTSSSAASIATAPDADETSPEPPAEAQDSPHLPDMSAVMLTPGLQGRNPLVDVVPRSNWSSFFTTRTLPTRKALDNKPASIAGPEVMEIDFGPSGVDPAAHTKKDTGSAAKRVLTMSSTNFSSLPLKASSSRMSTQSNGTTASTPGSVINTDQPDAASSSSSSTIKPLTKDKKGSKGSTTSTASKSKRSSSPKPPRPNLVLPSYDDTFLHPPRSLTLADSPAASPATLKKAVKASISYFFSSAPAKAKPTVPEQPIAHLKGKEREILGDKHESLPKDYTIAGSRLDLRGNGKIAVIGVHGWFIQGYLKNVVGEPTGTSTKFANMMKAAVKAYYDEKGFPLNDEAVTAIPLEGDGTVKDRAERLYENLMARQDWIEAVNTADRIFVASHSQGTIVSAMLVERLINEGEINGTKCMMLNMCSVSQGPFYSLYNSWTVPAYLYFETAAATELFEFQKPNSAVSKAYRDSLQHILNAGVKILFIASLNDQVVPLYSALFSSVTHPNILRSIFIDSSVFETNADFMTNLVVFSTRLRNAGLNCHGLDYHLSEALMGSLTGVGHSTVYDEPLVYNYAVRYLLETSSPLLHSSRHQPETDKFEVDEFNARAPANPFYLPWALRGIIEDTQIQTVFGQELRSLRDQFETWQPKTKALQQVQAALEPLRLIPRTAKSHAEFEAAVSRTDKKATAKL